MSRLLLFTLVHAAFTRYDQVVSMDDFIVGLVPKQVLILAEL
jgi:hypothetical protein